MTVAQLIELLSAPDVPPDAEVRAEVASSRDGGGRWQDADEVVGVEVLSPEDGEEPKTFITLAVLNPAEEHDLIDIRIPTPRKEETHG